MRDFSKVSPLLWESPRFCALPDDSTRLAFIYLLTSKHQNSAGAYKLARGYALVDLGWTGETFDAARDALIAAGMIDFDAGKEEYRIVLWFRHNAPMNVKHRMGIEKTLARLQSDAIREGAMAELDALCPETTKPLGRREGLHSNSSDLSKTDYLNRAGR